MKRVYSLILALCMVLTAIAPAAAFAAEQPATEVVKETPSNVTITVVMPEPTPEPIPETIPTPEIKLYPSDVTETREGGVWQIIKIYELNANENPADIPRWDFERSGWKFTLSDIIRKETASAETREHVETVTQNTDTKELEKILPMFAPTMDYTAEDGFVGILTLDVASIKVETAGTKTTSYEMKVTREYPRLSNTDTANVPKTVEEKGKTYTLASVDWKSGNYETVDYGQIPEYYTAVATYTATGTSTKVTGYVTTAQYSGSLAKLTQGKTVYTAYFEGEEIRTPLEMTELPKNEPLNETANTNAVPETTPEPAGEADGEPTEEPALESTEEPASEPAEMPAAEPAAASSGNDTDTALYVIIAIMAILLAGCAFYIIKNGKGATKYEKTFDSAVDADYDIDGGDSGYGG